jgi:2-keto-4-pentenoate hydratase
MEHLYQAEMEQEATDALTTHFPELSRERAYAIQKLRLEHREQSSRRVGWKIGWSRQANPEDELDPVVGHIMEDRVFAEDEPLSTRYFTEGSTGAEAEVVFYLNRDLPGPEVSAEEVADAVEAVGVAMEFVSGRLTQPHTREHAIADNVYGAGVVLGAERFPLDEVDLTAEIGRVEVNGEVAAEGPATSIMGEDPFAALVWIANELPKRGWHLEAGDFVVTGTVLAPPPVEAGDSARVVFTNLGSVSADFVE